MASTKTSPSKPKAIVAEKVAPVQLSAKIQKQLKEVGITATTEDQARQKLYAIFKKNEMLDLDDSDSLSDLISMASAFTGNKEDEEEEETVASVVSLDEEEAIDVETVKPAAKAKKPAKTKSIKPATVVAEINNEEEEEETNDEADAENDELVAEVETKKLAPVKKAVKPAKVSTKKSQRVRKLLGRHWNELSTAEIETALKPFRKVLDKATYHIELLNRSFMVKYLGKASEHNIFKFHLIRLLENGKLEGTFISHRIKAIADLQKYMPHDETHQYRGGDSCSYVYQVSQDQIFELLNKTDFLKDSLESATKQDTKMNHNRKKLETSLFNEKEKEKAKEKTTVKTTKTKKK